MGELSPELVERPQIEAFVSAAHKPLEALVHGFCDEAYSAIMESVQDYLRDNVLHNLKAALDAANRDARLARQEADWLRGERDHFAKTLRWYANPEIYQPHPHGPAFDRRDLSFSAKDALAKVGEGALRARAQAGEGASE